MTLVMAYVILVAAGVAAGAVLLEAVLRGRGAAARWVWVVAMAFTMAATLFAMIAPRRVAVEVGEAAAPVTSNALTLRSTELPLASSLPDANAATVVLDATDSVLQVAWLVATLVLLGALAIGQRRFRLERRKARDAKVGGHDVLLTEDLGPAVAGVRRPVVFVPRWVLALDNTSQQLLLAHEIEHVKRRDTSLLLFGAVTAAITPWNPVVWWMVRRLRLAVEQDCDARVLAVHPGVRRYADLLLTAASPPRTDHKTSRCPFRRTLIRLVTENRSDDQQDNLLAADRRVDIHRSRVARCCLRNTAARSGRPPSGSSPCRDRAGSTGEHGAVGRVL